MTTSTKYCNRDVQKTRYVSASYYLTVQSDKDGKYVQVPVSKTDYLMNWPGKHFDNTK
jgi:hypothetical protein